MPVNSAPRTTWVVALLVTVIAAAGCTKDAPASPAGGAAPANGGKSGDAPATAGVGGGAGGSGQGAGATRQAPSITLASTDIATIAPAIIEDGTALTGDLRPIETVDVRARLEGDLLQVLVREGQQVTAGQLLARIEDTQQRNAVKSAEADRASARSELANALWTYEQDSSLYKAGAIAQRDLKNAEQAVAAARARLAATESRVGGTTSDLRDTRVTAPSAGVVDKRMVQGTEHVSRGAALFSIVRNGTLELAGAVPARQASALRVGQVVHFVADGKRFDGHVARVSPTVDPQSRSVTVYVEIPNPGGTLRGGTFATGRVVSQTLTNVLAVPIAALKQSAENGKPFVYRVDGKTVNVAPITLGAVDERLGIAQVVEGLAAGDRVIVGNVGTIGRGMQVTIAGEEKGGKGKK